MWEQWKFFLTVNKHCFWAVKHCPAVCFDCVKQELMLVKLWFLLKKQRKIWRAYSAKTKRKQQGFQNGKEWSFPKVNLDCKIFAVCSHTNLGMIVLVQNVLSWLERKHFLVLNWCWRCWKQTTLSVLQCLDRAKDEMECDFSIFQFWFDQHELFLGIYHVWHGSFSVLVVKWLWSAFLEFVPGFQLKHFCFEEKQTSEQMTLIACSSIQFSESSNFLFSKDFKKGFMTAIVNCDKWKAREDSSMLHQHFIQFRKKGI